MVPHQREPLPDKDTSAMVLHPSEEDKNEEKQSVEHCGSDNQENFSALTTRDASCSLSWTVLGIYAKGEIPRKDELDDDDTGYAKRSPDQVMVRRRMNTRPIQQNDDDDYDDYETAMFVAEQGLVNSKLFFHADLEEHDESSDEEEEDDDDDEEEEEDYPQYELDTQERIYEERTILFQAFEHYEKVAAEPTMAPYFRSMMTTSTSTDENNNDNNNNNNNDDDKQSTCISERAVLSDQRFGEQVIVKGCDHSQICIGDIFQVVDYNNNNNNSQKEEEKKKKISGRLTVEVTSPRLACSVLDKRNSSWYGLRGLKRYTNTHGLAGWFARVLCQGELRDGMKLVRVSHPHPKWTLEYTAKALYGEGNRKYMMFCWAQWNRDLNELLELCSLKQLAWYEWKEEAQYILDRWDRIKGNGDEKKKKQSENKQYTAVSCLVANRSNLTYVLIFVVVLQAWCLLGLINDNNHQWFTGTNVVTRNKTMTDTTNQTFKPDCMNTTVPGIKNTASSFSTTERSDIDICQLAAQCDTN